MPDGQVRGLPKRADKVSVLVLGSGINFNSNTITISPTPQPGDILLVAAATEAVTTVSLCTLSAMMCSYEQFVQEGLGGLTLAMFTMRVAEYYTGAIGNVLTISFGAGGNRGIAYVLVRPTRPGSFQGIRQTYSAANSSSAVTTMTMPAVNAGPRGGGILFTAAYADAGRRISLSSQPGGWVPLMANSTIGAAYYVLPSSIVWHPAMPVFLTGPAEDWTCLTGLWR